MLCESERVSGVVWGVAFYQSRLVAAVGHFQLCDKVLAPDSPPVRLHSHRSHTRIPHKSFHLLLPWSISFEMLKNDESPLNTPHPNPKSVSEVLDMTCANVKNTTIGLNRSSKKLERKSISRCSCQQTVLKCLGLKTRMYSREHLLGTEKKPNLPNEESFVESVDSGALTAQWQQHSRHHVQGGHLGTTIRRATFCVLESSMLIGIVSRRIYW
ncbi:hypothetical protein IQ07DRAFT_104298 [Pyrenochaeta sp. DS3sAY3a]|nr:hypothetical protein IQ07DRAFT_104298 [Pyrenochaeta sp. DS3sAY3a]